MITPAKLGWMAGIVDLKGKVYFKKNTQRTTPQVVLMVESRFPGIIRELGAMVGTRPEAMAIKPMKEFMRRGCAEHCTEPHVHVNDTRTMPQVYRWTVTGIALAIVLSALEPVLTQDKGFQEVVAEVLAGVDMEGRGSGAVMSTVNRLITLGWPMPEEVAQILERKAIALRVLSGTPEDGEDNE
jgi:hypothetical protein